MAGQSQASRLVWWLLSALLTIAITGGSFWLSAMSSQASEIRHDLDQNKVTTSERLTGLERDVKYLVKSIDEIKQALTPVRVKR